jgi:hypothetical protein
MRHSGISCKTLQNNILFKNKSKFQFFGGECNKIIKIQLFNPPLKQVNYQHLYVFFHFGTEILLVL